MFDFLKKIFKKEKPLTPEDLRKIPIPFIMYSSTTREAIGEVSLDYEEFKYLTTFDIKHYYIRKKEDDLW